MAFKKAGEQMTRRLQWLPVLVLAAGVAALQYARAQTPQPLRTPLERVVPKGLLNLTGSDAYVRPEELRSARTSTYLAREYRRQGAKADTMPVEVHVCYYERQTSDKWLRAPRLCHMNPVWSILQVRPTQVQLEQQVVEVSQFSLQRPGRRAVALFWYQGRSRIESDLYRVRWNMLKDSMLKRRSDQALVRVLVPITTSEEHALERAREIARAVMNGVASALPS